MLIMSPRMILFVLVAFVAVISVAGKGPCGGQTILHGTSGILRYPEAQGYGRNYEPHLDCTWIIQAPYGTKIFLNFLKIDIELCAYHNRERGICGCDSVTVRDGKLNSDQSLGKYCGLKWNKANIKVDNGTFQFNSTASSMSIHLKTDFSIELKGFSAEWWTEKAVCPVGWTEKGSSDHREKKGKNMCYKYDARKVDYTEAQAICRAAGGDLAMPKTLLDLNNVIAVRNARYSTNYLWVGLDDKQTENTWVWNDNTTLAGGQNNSLWKTGTPNNGRNEDCAMIDESDRFNAAVCNVMGNSIMGNSIMGNSIMCQKAQECVDANASCQDIDKMSDKTEDSVFFGTWRCHDPRTKKECCATCKELDEKN